MCCWHHRFNVCQRISITKVKNMRSKVIERILKETPLKTRLKVSTEMAFISLISELGYRENKIWTDDENETLNKLCELAMDLVNDHIKEFEQWQKDGKP